MIIRKDQAPVEHAAEEMAQMYGTSESVRLSDAGGLTQFGAYVQTLQPGSRSSDRHWHEEQDEFLYMLSGRLPLSRRTASTCSIPATRPVGRRARRTPTRS